MSPAPAAARQPKRPAKPTRKPTLILLVRHGRTPSTGKVIPGRAKGLHLSDLGRRQAEEAGRRIAEMEPNPTALYASPLTRTKETAAGIAKALPGLAVKSEKGLLECETGEWTGARLTTLRRKPEWGTVQGWPSGFRFPGGESFPEMANRINETLLRLAKAHPGEAIVAVSHADPIRAALATAMGAPLDSLQRISIGPCSISAIVLGVGRPHVLCTGSVSTLAELAIG